jgi:hypothetical protein
MPTETSLRWYIGLVKETVKGTPIAPTTFPRWLDGATLDPKIAQERVLEGDGGRDSAFTLKKVQEYVPTIPCYPRPIEAGQLIAAAFGTVSDVKTGAGDPFTHTITPTNTPDYFTLEAGLTTADLINRIADCVVEELIIEAGAGMPVKFTTKWRGMTGARQASAATVTVEAGLPFLFSGGTFTVDGAGSTFVEKFKLTYKNVIEAPQTNVVTVNDLIWGRRTLDAEYTLLFQTDALYRKMFYGATGGTVDSQTVGNGAIDFTFLPGGVVQSPVRSMELAVPSIDYYGNEPQPKLTGAVFRYDVKGYGIHGGSPLITATIFNSQSTAY